ncbi:hypothetical protein ABT104_00635 [Streptomyces mobaraensis]
MRFTVLSLVDEQHESPSSIGCSGSSTISVGQGDVSLRSALRR